MSTPPRIDIHQYLAAFDDIPGTRVFTAKRARQGYWLNQFCMTLMKAENRERFKAERARLPGRVADDRGSRSRRCSKRD